jgi:predicted nucleic acid-binding protein
VTRVVLDARTAASWVLPDEEPASLEAIANAALVAPRLFWAEPRNILIVPERRGRLPEGTAEIHLAAVAALDVALDVAPEEATVLGLARAHKLTVYDALYLELALRRAASLATIDGPLAKAAAARGVALIG